MNLRKLQYTKPKMILTYHQKFDMVFSQVSVVHERWKGSENSWHTVSNFARELESILRLSEHVTEWNVEIIVRGVRIEYTLCNDLSKNVRVVKI